MGKENQIIELLEEMKIEGVKIAGFTDLYVKGLVQGEHKEEVDTWGIVDGYRSIVTKEVIRKPLIAYGGRLNDIDIDNTYVKDGILKVVYDGCKEAVFAIENIKKIFIMKSGDNNVY